MGGDAFYAVFVGVARKMDIAQKIVFLALVLFASEPSQALAVLLGTLF
ncbi:hypothetical protein MAXJ12_13196 [Mesorhizobium alhagi CCNWXJ12-2]|uniref:Uncharacterized protein n=1 Tax=Mesorhizobium alhagi CCNWXJ12-2 TaxID=1107882 RepID=H0HR56_9HYPH|nr:hypothetical protein MAXJ12_13196 [Mesorhizobium alhagi CCNWXJ12-2]